MDVLKVNDLSIKSFVNYTGPNIGEEFKKKNIIFGYNGRGKSSLATGVAEEFFKEKSNSQSNLRYFVRDYISENLLLKDDKNSSLKGVIANFGKKDVDAEKEISKLEDEIIDTQEIEEDIETLDKLTREEINKIHDNKKGKTSIQKKSADKSIKEILDLYNKDVVDSKKIIQSEEELILTKGDDTFEKNKELINAINIPNILFLEDNDIEDVKNIFDKNFDDIDIPSNKIIEWLNVGLEFHDNGDICKFCGNSININEIKERVDKYNSNEKRKATVKLTEFKTKLDKVGQGIKDLLNVKESIVTNLGNNVLKNFEIIEKSNIKVDEYKNLIHNKIDNMEDKSLFDELALKEINMQLHKNNEEIQKEKQGKIREIQDKIDKLTTLIKGAIGLEISKSTLINNNIKSIDKLINELNSSRDKNRINFEKIEDLKRSKSNTKDFADHINKIFSMIEVNLKLEVNKDDYIIKHSISKEILKIKDISEGEQNLLALLYFYYELFEDSEQKKLKSEIKLIIIDDPISSVDDINKMYVLELIKHLCLLDQTQVFIFTHVWEDFCNICYGKKDRQDTQYRFYEIRKDSAGSKIVIAKTNETPYKHGFKEIYDFSLKNDCTDLSDCEIYHYPNIMRKILEEFMEFKVKNFSPTSDNFNNIKLVLCPNSNSSNDDLMIGTLLNVCNILSHRASRNPDEILKAAKFLMKKIEIVDKLHFDTMKQ